MEKINISDIQLKRLVLQKNEQQLDIMYDDLHAVIKVQANTSGKSLVCIEIDVKHRDKENLFTVSALYQYKHNQSDVNDTVIEAVVKKVRPRVEELLSLLTVETGYLPIS